ncbi:CLUMA_CG007708, isoform A [Clunio marinus]|uniref:CLUMA_CG007708, isoform A n=1 Tax=Clunio marinus TaxID=568069 RepID=A0A1J1I1I8_9DIPT|nr:CLUMA_CG007708, isoform A [Clunio marinus]
MSVQALILQADIKQTDSDYNTQWIHRTNRSAPFWEKLIHHLRQANQTKLESLLDKSEVSHKYFQFLRFN